MAPSRVDSSPVASSSPSAAKLKELQGQGQDQYGHYHPADPASLSLESNFGPMDADSIGYLQPTRVDTPLEIMHERYERDGYLFVSFVQLLLSGCYY